jgi:hypothetical protein
LLPVLDAAGGGREDLDECKTLVRVSTGTVLLQKRFGVFCVSASGDALAKFRQAGLFGEYLAALSSVPHRVTRLDAAFDVVADAPNVIRSTWKRASLGRIALSRKRVPGENCSKHIARGIDGRETGTVYIGKPSAEVRGVQYDKRHEVWCRTGEDVGRLLRTEMRFKSGCGVTLADAHSPGPVFWHYAAPGLIDRPEGVQAWVPRAEGFEMPERMTFTANQLMERKLEGSADIRRLLELAEEMGPLGVDFLCQKLRRMAAWGEASPQGRPEGVEGLLARPTPLQ